MLVFGGLLVTYLTLDKIGGDSGVIGGFNELTAKLPEKFDMILSPDNPFYKDLPGISVLVGGMWIMNLSYWGFNQYIIQRALQPKVYRSTKGDCLCCLPQAVNARNCGIARYCCRSSRPRPKRSRSSVPGNDETHSRGTERLGVRSIDCRILSSLGSMMNSISTIFTMDIYRHFKPDTASQKLVHIGRVAALAAITIAMIIAKPLLGNFDQAFQFIQEFTGFFTPGIVVLFLLGMFWKRPLQMPALAAAVGSFLLSLAGRLFWPELPFMDRVGLVFIACLLLAVVLSLRSIQKLRDASCKCRRGQLCHYQRL